MRHRLRVLRDEAVELLDDGELALGRVRILFVLLIERHYGEAPVPRLRGVLELRQLQGMVGEHYHRGVADRHGRGPVLRLAVDGVAAGSSLERGAHVARQGAVREVVVHRDARDLGHPVGRDDAQLARATVFASDGWDIRAFGAYSVQRCCRGKEMP